MILVTGATGFIGRAVVEVLGSGRRPWIELARRPVDSSLRRDDVRVQVSADVTDADALAREVSELGDVTAIVHLAGVAPGMRPPRPDHEAAAMQSLVEVARARAPKLERFVFLSTTHADARSSVAWLRAKGVAEALLTSSGLPFVIVRAGLVFGAESPIFNALMQVVRSGLRIRLPLLRAGRLLPLAVGDVAIAVATALDHHLMRNEIVEMGTPPAISLERLLELVARRLGKRLVLARFPFQGFALAECLRNVPIAPLTDAAEWLKFFTIVDAVSVHRFDELLPMRRTDLSEAIREFPWGLPERTGAALPSVQPPPEPTLPLIIPGEALRGGAPGAPSAAELYGRVDPFGNPEPTGPLRPRVANNQPDEQGESHGDRV